MNGLNAAVVPIPNLIERLNRSGKQSLLTNMLMARMPLCLQAVDFVYDELEHVRQQESVEEPGRDDFGCCDPATD